MKKSPETLAKIVELAATGLPFTRCAEAVGVSISTLHRWKDEDATFATALEQSKALFIQSQHDKVVGSHDVADSRWLLERLDRDNYGRADAVQIDVRLDLPSLLPPEALKVDWKLLPDAGSEVVQLPEGDRQSPPASVGVSESRCVEEEE